MKSARPLWPGLLVGLLVIVSLGVTRGQEEGERWALIIGIDDYQKIRPLSFCVEDAKLLRDALLRNGFKQEKVRLLTDEAPEPDLRPTLSNIYSALDTWTKGQRPGDTLFFAFAGHGMRDADGVDYLMPVDASATSPQDTAIPLEAVVRRLQESQASTVIMSMDACRDLQRSGRASGGSGFGPSGAGLRGAADQAEHLAMLYACDADEQSHEWPERGHGVFTYYLVRGINGEAVDEQGRVTVLALRDYLRSAVTAWARDRGTIQTPQLLLDSTGGAGAESIVVGLAGGIATVEGVAMEAGSETPIPGVVVRLRNLQATTNARGRYAFPEAPAGNAEIVAQPPKPYQQPDPIPISAPPGSRVTADIPLQRIDRGMIRINIEPWAEVFLDATRVGETPLTIPNVTPGEHTLSWRVAGAGREQVRAVTVTAGETIRITGEEQ